MSRIILVSAILCGWTQAASAQLPAAAPPRFRFPPAQPALVPHEAPLRFASPANHPHATALADGARWLTQQVVHIETGGDAEPLALIAWWDPTLSTDQRDLVAYTITDTLWAAWALRPFCPEVAAHLARSLDRLHARSNGFMDQPFHLQGEFRLLNVDADHVHGSVVTTAYAAVDPNGAGDTGPRQVQVRSMHFRVASEQENRDFAATFIDAAVYYAFHLFWQGDRETARALLLRCLDPQAGIPIHYDAQLGLLLDAADQQINSKMPGGSPTRLAYAPFKQALFLFAVRQMGLVNNGVSPEIERQLERRVLEAQNLSGGFRHVVFTDAQGQRMGAVPPGGGTGETAAIVILALLSLPMPQ